jgi:hypothetical protein
LLAIRTTSFGLGVLCQEHRVFKRLGIMVRETLRALRSLVDWRVVLQDNSIPRSSMKNKKRQNPMAEDWAT